MMIIDVFIFFLNSSQPQSVSTRPLRQSNSGDATSSMYGLRTCIISPCGHNTTGVDQLARDKLRHRAVRLAKNAYRCKY